MNIKNLNIKAYENIENKIWDNCALDFDGNINYTSWMINYHTIYNKSKEIKNFSFVLYNSDEVALAIVPLYIEKINSNYQISVGEGTISSPLFNQLLSQKDIISLYGYILEYIDTLSIEHNCILARFQIPSLNMQTINYYKLFGYKEQILNPDWYIYKCDYSYIIALEDKAISDIRSNIRNSFKSLINKTKNGTNLIILDKNNTDREIFDKYVDTHYEIKGNTRTKEAFEEDYKAVCNGLETILICEYENVYIGVVVLYTFNKKAVYNSAMQRYDYDKLYPNHFLMWESIEYLHNNEYEYFLNGEQVVENLDYEVSEKEKNISYFKTAWGGELYPWFQAQKVYDVSTV
jgi:hypothetical protein